LSFASPTFLWYFLPATLVVYLVLPARWRNGVLAVASLVFYAAGGGVFLLLLLACMLANFLAGLAVDSGWAKARPRPRAGILISAIAFDLGALVVWKYADFASRQIRHLTDIAPVLHIVLPIGISFFTFHHLSYVVDVYRGSRPAQRHPLTFITYIAMFPQLIAGPIVRYHEISEQLTEVRHHRIDDIAAGFPRFALGLAKKVVIADSVAPIANTIFGSDYHALNTPTAWAGALAYTVQIYFDFSGYSDMAIGLGRMFGFQLPENFARPYSAVSITDFWRRWHMSLSRWFRDYLYIPLGGNRGSSAATYRNLYVVFALTGLWHGANWTFLAWGLYHGTLLVIERVTGLGQLAANSYPLPRRAVTLLLVVCGWVLFRAESIGQAAHILRLMLIPDVLSSATVTASLQSHQAWSALAVGLLVVLVPASFVMGPYLEGGQQRTAAALRVGYAAIAAPVAAVLVAAGTFSPFLYFRF